MTISASKNSVKNQVINDFGQKIGGAHKDRAREAAERLAGVEASALMLQPLSKVAKLPDLRALYLAGAISSDVARLAWYFWSLIGTKPGGSYPSRLQRWADRAAALIGEVSRVLSYGIAEKSQISNFLEVERPAQTWDLFNAEMTAANWPADEYKRGAYFVGPYWMNGARYSIHTEKASYYTAFDTVADAVAAIRAKVDKNTTKAPQKFSMYKTSAGVYYITPKGKAGIKLAAFTEAERAPMVEPAAGILPNPPAVVTYDPAQPIESAPFHVQDEAPAVAASEPMNAEEDEAPTPADGVKGAAYGSSEKSQIFDNMEESARILAHHQRMKREHPEAVILYRMGNFYESYFQDAQTVADCTGVIVRKHHGVPVAGFPFHALDTYLPRLVRAGLRVAICDDPRPTTPTDGGKGAAYGSSEKSQLPEKMSREEQDSIAAAFGLVPESHGYDGTLYMLKDAAGYPVKNDKGETLQINIDAHIELNQGPNGNPALWQRKGYTRDRLTNWWSIRTYCTREDGSCFEDYNPTVLNDGRRFIINFGWTLSITAENLKRIIAEVLRRFYGDSQKSQICTEPGGFPATIKNVSQ